MFVEQTAHNKNEFKTWIALFKSKIDQKVDGVIYQSPHEERIFGVEILSSDLEILRLNLTERLCKHFGLSADGAYSSLMYNHIRANEQNIGSGGSWHRDSNQCQYKAIMYLSDVSEKTGPFEYVIETGIQKWWRILKNGLNLRYGDDKSLVGDKIVGVAGTTLFADTSRLHRGSPIQQGERHALTLYFYTKKQLNTFVLSKMEGKKIAS